MHLSYGSEGVFGRGRPGLETPARPSRTLDRQSCPTGPIGALSKELYREGIHVATVTIAGQIRRNTPFDPDLIAEKFWELHAQPPGKWETEVIYQG